MLKLTPVEMELLCLPNELLLDIFDVLHPGSVLQFSLANRRLHALSATRFEVMKDIYKYWNTISIGNGATHGSSPSDEAITLMHVLHNHPDSTWYIRQIDYDHPDGYHPHPGSRDEVMKMLCDLNFFWKWIGASPLSNFVGPDYWFDRISHLKADAMLVLIAPLLPRLKCIRVCTPDSTGRQPTRPYVSTWPEPPTVHELRSLFRHLCETKHKRAATFSLK